MTLHTLRSIGGLIIVLVTFGTAVAQQPEALLESKRSSESLATGKRGIEGAWKNHVDIVICDTRQVLGSFPGLLNYHFGGTMSETGGDTPNRSSGAGVWAFRGDNQYDARFVFYTFTATGAPSGYFKVYQKLTLSEGGNQLTDNATYEIFDVNGTLVVSGCAVASATRL